MVAFFTKLCLIIFNTPSEVDEKERALLNAFNMSHLSRSLSVTFILSDLVPCICYIIEVKYFSPTFICQ